jgi:hypothetical protein
VRRLRQEHAHHYLGWTFLAAVGAVIAILIAEGLTLLDNGACFIVKDGRGQKLAYVYYEEEPGRRSSASYSPAVRHGALRQRGEAAGAVRSKIDQASVFCGMLGSSSVAGFVS